MLGFGLRMAERVAATNETKIEKSQMTSIAFNAIPSHVSLKSTRETKLDYARELASVTASIQEPLSKVESLIKEQLVCRDADVQSLLNFVAELGGKRLRPALVLLSAKAQSEINTESIRSAAAVELVHTATLVHDDILDNAELRRHRPALHCQSNVHDSILIGDWFLLRRTPWSTKANRRFLAVGLRVQPKKSAKVRFDKTFRSANFP